MDKPALWQLPRLENRASGESHRHEWFRIVSRADTSAVDVFLYNDIGIWGVTADDFRRQLDAIDSEASITVRINSDGGAVSDGVAIYNALRERQNVTTQVDGLAASIASVIAMAGDSVVVSDASMMMIHDASIADYGNADEKRKLADLLDKVSTNIAEVYAAKAGGTSEEWRTKMKAETWYTASEAVAAGLADRLKSTEASNVVKVAPKMGTPPAQDDGLNIVLDDFIRKMEEAFK